MAKFMNVVRTTVKADCHDEFLEHHSKLSKYDGLFSQFLIQTGDYSYCFVAIWESERSLVEARTLMIESLNSMRHTLEEFTPELDVTDPVSGPVILEQ